MVKIAGAAVLVVVVLALLHILLSVFAMQRRRRYARDLPKLPHCEDRGKDRSVALQL
jgi:hypothetical protein